jgi:hypothetical protein
MSTAGDWNIGQGSTPSGSRNFSFTMFRASILCLYKEKEPQCLVDLSLHLAEMELCLDSAIHHHGLLLNLRGNYAFKLNNIYSEIKRSDNYIFTCGQVVRVSGYRSRGPGSIPEVTRFFSEK